MLPPKDGRPAYEAGFRWDSSSHGSTYVGVAQDQRQRDKRSSAGSYPAHYTNYIEGPGAKRNSKSCFREFDSHPRCKIKD